MDYKIEHKEGQQFLALVKSFPNEIINDDNDQSIPDFWTECFEKDLIGPMKQLRTEGKRDLYGLCSPVKDNGTHFNYGIGMRSVKEIWNRHNIFRVRSLAAYNLHFYHNLLAGNCLYGTKDHVGRS